MKRLQGKVAIVTGASRGIGRAVALAFAREGADVVIAAKSDQPSPKLPGTIHSVADEVRSQGARALALKVDVRDDADVDRMAAETMATFGRIDILVNDAGALWWQPVLETPMKRYDDEDFLRSRGVTDFTRYRCDPDHEPPRFSLRGG